MLRRFLALLAMLGASFVVVVSVAPSANADGCDVDEETGEVVCDEEDGGNTDGGGGHTRRGSSTCTFQNNEIPCQGPAESTWNGQCYVGMPLPPDGKEEAGPNGETIPAEGRWHICYLPAGMQGPANAWVGVSEVLVDPVTLAHRAVAAMDLDPITIGIVPESGADRVGLVGLPVWMWVDGQTEDTWGPITRSASEGPVSVTATASVSSVIWDMGDGTKVTCTGPGTPYADQYGKQDSPTCGHRYEKMSTDQPDGAYQVTATSHWVVEWAGGGQSGTIELDLTTNPLPIRIGEAQVLTQ